MAFDEQFPCIVCSVLETEPERAQAAIRQAPARCLVELRGDRMGRDDVLDLVRRAERPVLVTLRRLEDGGRFEGSEEERRRTLLAALGAGAELIDVEWNSELRSLVQGKHAARVVLSHHGARLDGNQALEILGGMVETGARLLKLVPLVDTPGQIGKLKALLARPQETRGRRLACFGTGKAGSLSRLLAPSWGSWATYGAPRCGEETAPGQFTVDEMIDLYDVLGIADGTRRFALLGNAVSGSPSPAMHAAAYREAGLDARYLPLEVESLQACEPLLRRGGPLGVEALAVTIPFKGEAAARCTWLDDVACRSEAVNTVRLARDGWRGYNTDGPAVRSLVEDHLELDGARVAVVGAGGTARAAAFVLREAGASVTLYNRTVERARRVADLLGVQAAPFGALPAASWDVLVQATPLGRNGESVCPPESLAGRVVIDAVYGATTPLVAAARQRGLVTFDGFALLVAQALLQFEVMTGARARAETMQHAGSQWLVSRGLPA